MAGSESLSLPRSIHGSSMCSSAALLCITSLEKSSRNLYGCKRTARASNQHRNQTRPGALPGRGQMLGTLSLPRPLHPASWAVLPVLPPLTSCFLAAKDNRATGTQPRTLLLAASGTRVRKDFFFFFFHLSFLKEGGTSLPAASAEIQFLCNQM